MGFFFILIFIFSAWLAYRQLRRLYVITRIRGMPARAYCAMTNLQEAVLPSLSMTFAM